MTGVMRKRAKSGMTIPAAPRITSASETAGEIVAPCIAFMSDAPVSRRNRRSDLLIVGGGPAGDDGRACCSPAPE